MEKFVNFCKILPLSVLLELQWYSSAISDHLTIQTHVPTNSGLWTTVSEWIYMHYTALYNNSELYSPMGHTQTRGKSGTVGNVLRHSTTCFLILSKVSVLWYWTFRHFPHVYRPRWQICDSVVSTRNSDLPRLDTEFVYHKTYNVDHIKTLNNRNLHITFARFTI